MNITVKTIKEVLLPPPTPPPPKKKQTNKQNKKQPKKETRKSAKHFNIKKLPRLEKTNKTAWPNIFY